MPTAGQVYEIATDGNIYQIAGDSGNATSAEDWSATSWDRASNVVFGKDSAGVWNNAWINDIAYDQTLGIIYVLNGSYNQSTQKSEGYRIIAVSKR